LDEEHDGDVRALTEPHVSQVMDECFQCKLCEVQCPYTPRDSHEFKLDFPKLVHRFQAQRTKREGNAFRERVLGDPDRTGRLARMSLGLANVANRTRVHRWFMERFLGIHRDKDLPTFAAATFESWARKVGRLATKPDHEAVLFQTCFVQNNEPQIGRDTLEVMDANQVDCRAVEGLVCCGMPAWEHGDLDTVRANAKINLDILLPHVQAGAKVLVLQPSCAMLLRRELPELMDGPDRARAELLAEAVCSPSELLWSIRKEDRYNTDYKSGLPEGTVLAYHAPCHTRAQAKGFRGRDVLRKLPGVSKVKTTMECCGHDGTYAMKVESFEASARIGKRSFDEMKEAEAEVWVTDCGLAAMQFRQHAGHDAQHPMSVLARAHREHGFAHPKRLTDGEDP
jgi:Fe-S oxidoreductase